MLRKVMGQNTGSGGGSVGRAVAYDARGPRFESSHRQIILSDIYLFTVNCIEKTKIKKKTERSGPTHQNPQFESNQL